MEGDDFLKISEEVTDKLFSILSEYPLPIADYSLHLTRKAFDKMFDSEFKDFILKNKSE